MTVGIEEVERFGGLVGRRCGRFSVRDFRGRDVMADELRTVYVQSIV